MTMEEKVKELEKELKKFEEWKKFSELLPLVAWQR